MELNIWTWPFRFEWYLRHPWEWFAHLWQNIKCSWQRITKGYCDRDLWNFDKWILETFAEMFDEFARESEGYPGIEPFETPEKWESWLKDIAVRLKRLQTDWAEEFNEYEDDWRKVMNVNTIKYKNENGMPCVKFEPNGNEELIEKWRNRFKELEQEQDKETRIVFEEIGKNLYRLWW